MKRYIRCICLLLSLLLLTSMTVSAADNSSEAAPYSSSFFQRYSTYLPRYSSTMFHVYFDVTACGYMTELGVSSIEVQRSADGISGWTTTKTYTPDIYSQMMANNVFSHGGTVLYAGTAGYYYRAYVTFYAKNSSGSAKYYAYTDVLKL